jgi:hypothetical protein
MEGKGAGTESTTEGKATTEAKLTPETAMGATRQKAVALGVKLAGSQRKAKA